MNTHKVKPSNQDVSYTKSFNFEKAQRGNYKDLTYNPVFRASALFFVHVGDNIDTCVAFMNYWREKNSNDAVSAMVTLRDAEGQKVFRDYLELNDCTYQFSVKELTDSVIFTGSLEVELFSFRDLKYSFPALEVFYVTPEGVSCVHSNQRVFNSLEEIDQCSALNACQTGFDILCDEYYTGYITIVNGPKPIANSTLRIVFYNALGGTIRRSTTLGDLPAYASRLVVLNDIPGVLNFMNGQPGFCKFDVDIYGVFARLACGSFALNGSRFAVTHSYYDCTTHYDYFDHSTIPDTEYHCFLPINLVSEIETEAVFYPIYSPASLRFSIEVFSSQGELLHRIENIGALDNTTTGTMARLNIRSILGKYSIEMSDGLVCLDIRSDTGKIPARLTFGLNYFHDTLGTNINASIFINESYGIRKRSYLWGSAYSSPSGKNYILISHLSKVKGITETASLKVTLFNRQGSIIIKTIDTRNATAINIRVEDWLLEAGYTASIGEILWYTLESDCPNFTAVQLHEDTSGFIGGDHSF
ncbi:MAG: hypothetical protein IV298_14350 [Cylindrospermopsis raciborskii KL1]|jgi:hypothetical protein|uniref:hypothetical protein n=1 Tax=Cylindrospermopsis raciborskii TaxID=77022 RepID=UPI001A197A5D|nr:hypothetical protein [Cylindrospermopsis raciborskii]MBG0744636.1 hypothetical protein [Cylindrospermopsis raciborskii KL1]